MSESYWARGGLFSFLFDRQRRTGASERGPAAPSVALGLAGLSPPRTGTLYAVSVSGPAHACMFKLLLVDDAEMRVTLEALDLATLAGPGERDMDNVRALDQACPWREEGALAAERAAALRAELEPLPLATLGSLPETQVITDWHLSGLVWPAGGPPHAFEAMAPRDGAALAMLRLLHRAANEALRSWRSLGVLDLAMFYDPSLGQLVRDLGGRPRHVRVLAPTRKALPQVLAALDRLPTDEPMILDLAPLNHEARALSRWALDRPSVLLVMASGKALSELPAEALPRVYGSVDEALADVAAPTRNRSTLG